MLKLFLLFVSIFISVSEHIKADEIKWYEEEIEKGMISEKKYRFYTLEKDGEYVRKDIETSHEYIDENDISYSEYSNWKSECINNNIGYEIEYGKEYEYQKLEPINYIKIFNTSNNNVKINDIVIYNNNSLLNYELYSYSGYLRESNILQPMGHIMIYFQIPVKLNTLNIGINFDKSSNYEIYFSEDKYFKKIIAYTKGNSTANDYVYNDNYIVHKNYSEILTGYNINENDYVEILSVKDVCREREILTYRYNFVKKYFDDNYYFNINDIKNFETDKLLYKDESDYKVYYRYKFDNEYELEPEIKLVKTGVEKEEKNYVYLKCYILSLLLITVILIIYKNMSIKKNN